MADLFSPDSVRFVLVEPQGAGNLGSTARALKNLGFFRLVLVRPTADPTGREARMMAVDAADLLAGAVRSENLDEACRGAKVVVGLTARTGKQRSPHLRLDELVADLRKVGLGEEIAVLFGREDRGLTDRELDACTHLAFLPSSPAYPSFNVAQAVLLVAYELRMASLREGKATPASASMAEHASREALYLHLEQALTVIGFLQPEPAEVIMRQFRRLLGRARMTEREVKLLRGVARQVIWAAEQSGSDSEPGE